jgi:hypothetical protein
MLTLSSPQNCSTSLFVGDANSQCHFTDPNAPCEKCLKAGHAHDCGPKLFSKEHRDFRTNEDHYWNVSSTASADSDAPKWSLDQAILPRIFSMFNDDPVTKQAILDKLDSELHNVEASGMWKAPPRSGTAMGRPDHQSPPQPM